jgi:protein-disulfide isomerase
MNPLKSPLARLVSWLFGTTPSHKYDNPTPRSAPVTPLPVSAPARPEAAKAAYRAELVAIQNDMRRARTEKSGVHRISH